MYIIVRSVLLHFLYFFLFQMDYADSSSQTSPAEIKLFDAVLSPASSPDQLQHCTSTTFLTSERSHRLQSTVSQSPHFYVKKGPN